MKLKISVSVGSVSVDCPNCKAGLEIANNIPLSTNNDIFISATKICGRWAASHVCGAEKARNDSQNAVTRFFTDIASSISRISFK